MMPNFTHWDRAWLGCLCTAVLGGALLAAEPILPPPRSSAPALTLEEAVYFALEHNPELATLRQQHGIASAAVLIAQTYPYNPDFQNQIQYVNGPPEAGTTYHFPYQTAILWQVQIRGQRGYKKQEASAALSRTDWEIAAQEQALAVRVIRAFRALQYRLAKLQLIDVTIRVNEQSANEVSKLMEQGKLRGADLLLARTEVDAARALLGMGQAASVAVRFELRRALGLVEGVYEIQGNLEPQIEGYDLECLTKLALDRRADLHALQMAVAETEARLRYTVADRFGDPFIGPVVNMDNTRDYYTGALINIPLPIHNTHRGEILQRKAEQTRALLQVHQRETEVRQDVQAALARLGNARAWVQTYRTQTLPSLEANLHGIEKLFLAGEPGVDVLRVIEVRRRLLQARDGYLDALWEVSQAEADLAAAVGDPAVAIVPAAPVPNPARQRRSQRIERELFI